MPPGRPRKDQISISQFKNYEYDMNCEQISQLLATQSNYNVIIQNGKKNKEDDQISSYDRKTQKIEHLLISEGFDSKHIFFLRNKSLNLTIVERILIDNTMYPMIQATEFIDLLRPLIQKMNDFVSKQLNESMIDIMKKILKLYEQNITSPLEENDKKQQIDFIIGKIREPQNYHDFKYLLVWENLKDLTESERFQQRMKHFKICRKKIRKLREGKAKKKHESFIKQQELEIYKQKDQGCLLYLIENLVKLFNEIMNESLVNFD